MNAEPAVRIHDHDGIRVLTFARADAMNPIGPALIHELDSAIADAGDDCSVRAVVLAGEGSGWCAGADLDLVRANEGRPLAQMWEMPSGSDAYGDVGPGSLCLQLEAFDKPLIAAINGAVAGGGLGLALVCDMRIASEKAVFTTAFARLGVSPDMGVSWTLPRLVGPSRAAELLFSGRLLDGDEALVMGLVDEVVPAAQLEDRAMSLAGQFAANPPSGLVWAKRALRAARRSTLAESLELEWAQQQAAFDDPDVRQRIARVLDRQRDVSAGSSGRS